MRNTIVKLPVRSITLLAAIIMATLFLTNYLSPDLTHATTVNQIEAGSTEPLASDQTDGQTLANCRYGASASPSETHILPTIGAGVFYDWRYDWPYPMPANDAEFLHMIRPRQAKSKGVYFPSWYTDVPLNDDLAKVIRDDPGAIWMIGNEPERGPNPGETWSARTDDIHADIYAEAYHDIYHFIKGIDPTARIANAGLIQITPMRLQYLEMMWDAYLQKYGVPMPVDVWTIHAYVLPELTPDGRPNNIASQALGTDLTLGKHMSGGDASKCADSDVYCYAEHDDPSLVEEQVIAMRQFMKDRGQQEKPLVVTEFSTLYHYIVKEDGSCGGLFDEFGKCFTPERVSTYMLEAFDYFNNAQDPALGMPTDNNKLVQQWIWYDAYGWDIGSSNLLQDDRQNLSLMGQTFKNHVFSEPTAVNLVVDRVSGTVTANNENETSTAKLSVSFRNNGNVSIESPFTVSFYKNAALTQKIGSITVTPDIRGCATRAYTASANWEGLAKGTHQFWVKLDRTNAINEINEADNIGTGQVEVTGPVYDLDVEIFSDGEGVGGSVSATPEGPTYPEGTVVTLTAVPASGWKFTGWQGAIVGSVPQVNVSMNNDVTLEAHFKQDHYQLNVDEIGKGAVTVAPQQDYYLFGDKSTLTAVPSAGWRFIEWRGDVDAGTPTIELSFEGDVNITAVFGELIPDVSHNAFSPIVIGGS